MSRLLYLSELHRRAQQSCTDLPIDLGPSRPHTRSAEPPYGIEP